MLQSVEMSRTDPVAQPKPERINLEPRRAPIGLDGDYGDDGSQLLDQMLWLWRQP